MKAFCVLKRSPAQKSWFKRNSQTNSRAVWLYPRTASTLPLPRDRTRETCFSGNGAMGNLAKSPYQFSTTSMALNFSPDGKLLAIAEDFGGLVRVGHCCRKGDISQGIERQWVFHLRQRHILAGWQNLGRTPLREQFVSRQNRAFRSDDRATLSGFWTPKSATAVLPLHPIRKL